MLKLHWVGNASCLDDIPCNMKLYIILVSFLSQELAIELVPYYCWLIYISCNVKPYYIDHESILITLIVHADHCPSVLSTHTTSFLTIFVVQGYYLFIHFQMNTNNWSISPRLYRLYGGSINNLWRPVNRFPFPSYGCAIFKGK